MKTYFKDIYLPVKKNITGVLLNEEYRQKSELQKAIRITYTPVEFWGKRCIHANYFFCGRSRWFVYGKTIKEIRELIKDINEFREDPYLFLSL